jgi:acyl-CoA synthetase (AMP-forming)/AMP-acid ligase II
VDIGQLVARSASRYANRVAIEGPQGTQTYAQLGDRVIRLANALLGLGFQPGDRVLDLQPNQNSSIEMDLACCTAGLVRVVLNYRLHADDWARIADDCGAVGMVYDARYAEPSAPLRNGFGAARTIAIGDGPGLGYEALIASASPVMPAIDRGADDLVSLNYTSGTTGRPKGVRRTHRNRWSCLVGMTYDVLSAVPSEQDTYLHAGPITHTSGLFVLPFIAGGGRQLIHPSYDAAAVAEAVADRGVTHTALVPTMVARLLALDSGPLHGLKMLGYAGAPMPPEQIRQAYERLTPHLVQYYGLVEAIPPVTVLTAEDHASGLADDPAILTSAGRPALGVSLRTVDEDGKPVPAGEIGEVVVRGDLVMSGYWGAAGGSVRAVVDGWLHTGDLGRLDETGRLWLVDRKGDMIITGGYNVYPREVEDVIAAVPGVREVAVLGIRDPDWGQRVVALYTGSATSDAVAGFCRDQLASFKRPKEVRRVDEFPLNATGKIAKNVLRAQLEA